MGQLKKNTYFGKYREIIIAVVLFLVLDISVLVFNFYTSFQIDQDTVAINLSGRQRYVSQRVARTLLELDASRASGNPYEPATLDELRNGANIFQRSMVAFHDGGVVPGGDGKPVKLEAVTSVRGSELEALVEEIWNPYFALLTPIISKPDFTAEELSAALAYSQANNIKLLNLANDFVTETQAIGASRASKLRMIQTVGILLSLLNFAYTVFASLRQLLRNDRKVEAARRETAEILATVKDGLFLLNSRLQIGSQFSESLPRILGRRIEPDSDFKTLLQNMVPGPVVTIACDYIELLFSDHVKEALVADLNPLSRVEVTVPQNDGPSSKRYLKLEFSRVLEDGKISHLLVTVIDISVQVELERALATAQQKAKVDMEIMLNLLKVNPQSLEHFLKSAEQSILEVNDQLKSAGGQSNSRSLVSAIFRKVHAIKGEAATLELDMFENLAQQFENLLVDLRDKGQISGEDLLALPFPVEEFLQHITKVRNLTGRLAAYHDAFVPATDDVAFAENLTRLTQRIAQDHGKEVSLVTDLQLLNAIPEKTRGELKDIAVQLLRNAVAHGIEPVAERVKKAKPSAGNLYLGFKTTPSGGYELTMRDDGQGLVPKNIRSALIDAQLYTEAQVNELDDRQVVMKIFEPGFSTAKEASKDAGHGVGMDIVKHKAEQLGAKVRISSKENAFTQFSVLFAA